MLKSFFHYFFEIISEEYRYLFIISHISVKVCFVQFAERHQEGLENVAVPSEKMLYV